MADRTPYPLQIITPDGTAFEGEVQELLVTGKSGGMGFFARHAPLVADLKMGHVRAKLADDSWRTWATEEGFAQVHDSSAMVLVEEAVPAEEIDLNEADRLISEAQSELEKAQTGAAAVSDESDEEAVYQADADKAQRQLAWGENLRAIHESTGERS